MPIQDKKSPGPYEIYAKEPESMNVGTLNAVVRALREELYQRQLTLQDAVDESLERAAEICSHLSGHQAANQIRTLKYKK